jgi:hypothetical protein
MITKTCIRCQIEKPIPKYHKDSGKKDGYHTTCKLCSCSRERKRYHANQVKDRNLKLRRKYGISHNDYLELLEAQNGRCAICGTDVSGGKGAFHVDHCHNSGQIRGLLCHSCNVGLGHFNDQESLLLKAALYLHNHHDHSTPSN